MYNEEKKYDDDDLNEVTDHKEWCRIQLQDNNRFWFFVVLMYTVNFWGSATQLSVQFMQIIWCSLISLICLLFAYLNYKRIKTLPISIFIHERSYKLHILKYRVLTVILCLFAIGGIIRLMVLLF